MVVNIANYVGAFAGAGAILYLVWLARRPDQERIDEESAREFFDRNGHWPDEPPEAARPLGPSAPPPAG